MTRSSLLGGVAAAAAVAAVCLLLSVVYWSIECGFMAMLGARLVPCVDLNQSAGAMQHGDFSPVLYLTKARARGMIWPCKTSCVTV